MVGRRTPLNSLQKLPTIIRCSVYTGVGSSAASEAACSQGGVSGYRVPVGTRGIIKGTLVLNALGSNTFIVFRLFDTVSGRQIPVARVDASSSKSDFEVEVDREITLSVTGDNVANDGSCEVMLFSSEAPV